MGQIAGIFGPGGYGDPESQQEPAPVQFLVIFVIGAAMIINLIVAGLFGILIPMALDALDIDPAVASGAFVTTVTDVVGFFAFLGLAAVWLV